MTGHGYGWGGVCASNIEIQGLQGQTGDVKDDIKRDGGREYQEVIGQGETLLGDRGQGGGGSGGCVAGGVGGDEVCGGDVMVGTVEGKYQEPAGKCLTLPSGEGWQGTGRGVQCT